MVAVATPPAPAISAAPVAAPRSRRHAGWVLLLLGTAAGLRFFHIADQSIWYDEGVSVGMVGLDPAAIIRQAAADFHPPLYYLLLAGWARLFGDGEVALRGMSACAGVLVVLLTWLLARRLFGTLAGRLAGGWAALSPLGVAFSQELRMYMLVAAGVALAAWFASVWLDAGAGRLPARRPWFLAGYALTAAAAVYVQYVALFGIAAIALYGLLRAPRRDLAAWIGANLLGALLFVPWLPALHYQFTIGRKAAVNQGGHDVLAAAFGSLLVGADGLPWATGPAVALLSLLVTAGFFRALAAGRRGLLPIFLTVLPVLGTALGAAWKAVYEVHYILAALPGIAILGALGLEQTAAWAGAAAGRLRVAASVAADPGGRPAPTANGRLDAVETAVPAASAGPLRVFQHRLAVGVLMVAGLLVIIASGSADLRYLLAPPHPHDDYRGLAAAVVGEGQPGDAVLLDAPGQDHVFRYYYRGPDAVIGLPLQRPPAVADVTSRLETLFRDHPRVWLVQYGATEADPAGVIPAWLGGHAFLAGHRWFGSVQLLLYAAGTAAGETPLGTRFANGAQLAAYAVVPTTLQPGGTLGLTLVWLVDTPPGARYTVFTHLLDTHNKVVAQHDGEPAGGTRPTTTWQPGERIRDLHGLTLPADLAPGAYTLEVGMYLPSGQRAAVLNVAGVPVGDHLLLGKVLVRAGG